MFLLICHLYRSLANNRGNVNLYAVTLCTVHAFFPQYTEKKIIVNFSSSFVQSWILFNWNLSRVRKTRWQLNNDRWRWLHQLQHQMKSTSKNKNSFKYMPIWSHVFFLFGIISSIAWLCSRHSTYWASLVFKSLYTFFESL